MIFRERRLFDGCARADQREPAAAVKLHSADVVVRLGDDPWSTAPRCDLHAGELTVLIGPNGAGKTTLMRALAGRLPAEGRIASKAARSPRSTPRERARRIAYLPQGHVFHWPMPVAAVVALGRSPRCRRVLAAVRRRSRRGRARAGGDRDRGLAARAVTALSGGERRGWRSRARWRARRRAARRRAHGVARSAPPAGGDGAAWRASRAARCSRSSTIWRSRRAFPTASW